MDDKGGDEVVASASFGDRDISQALLKPEDHSNKSPRRSSLHSGEDPSFYKQKYNTSPTSQFIPRGAQNHEASCDPTGMMTAASFTLRMVDTMETVLCQPELSRILFAMAALASLARCLVDMPSWPQCLNNDLCMVEIGHLRGEFAALDVRLITTSDP